jgi:hypothetical protein
MGTANGQQPAEGAPSDKLRHVESMSELPSGAGKISGINAVVLGESLAAEENDLIVPSPEFSASALVSSPKQVCAKPKLSTRRTSLACGLLILVLLKANAKSSLFFIQSAACSRLKAFALALGRFSLWASHNFAIASMRMR